MEYEICTVTETDTVAGYSLLAEPIEVVVPLSLTDAEVAADSSIDTSGVGHDEENGA